MSTVNLVRMPTKPTRDSRTEKGKKKRREKGGEKRGGKKEPMYPIITGKFLTSGRFQKQGRRGTGRLKGDGKERREGGRENATPTRFLPHILVLNYPQESEFSALGGVAYEM